VKVRNSKPVFPDESVGFIFLLFSLPYIYDTCEAETSTI
jgi:hypothetical protein